MDFFETILKRHSVRAYLSKPVEEKKLKKIMGAGLHSASAHHRQPYKVFVVKEKKLRQGIVRANHPINFWLKEAPVIMVICLAGGKKEDKKYPLIDAGIMLANIMLAATALGLGSCACGAFKAEKVKKILKLSINLKPIICLPVGYPRNKRKRMIDLSKDYEKLSRALLHYKDKKIDDIFIPR
ncbi:MAG: nitroreductase family protein [Patescibacteria group bacterium]